MKDVNDIDRVSSGDLIIYKSKDKHCIGIVYSVDLSSQIFTIESYPNNIVVDFSKFICLLKESH